MMPRLRVQQEPHRALRGSLGPLRPGLRRPALFREAPFFCKQLNEVDWAALGVEKLTGDRAPAFLFLNAENYQKS